MSNSQFLRYSVWFIVIFESLKRKTVPFYNGVKDLFQMWAVNIDDATLKIDYENLENQYF